MSSTPSIRSERRHSITAFNVLHTSEEDANNEENIIDEDDDDHDDHGHGHEHEKKKELLESFDFNDRESIMWRKVSEFVYVSY